MSSSPLISTLQEYHLLGIPEQIDYKKFYLYSIITHSTAIEGSTVTEIENQLLFDEGITATGRTLQEQMTTAHTLFGGYALPPFVYRTKEHR